MTNGISVRLRAALLVAIATAVPIARAQQASTNYLLTVRTDHTDSLYHQGEPVTFNIRLARDAQPVADAEVQWKTTKDGMPPTRTGTLKLVDGAGSVSGTLDEPGFLQCSVTYKTPAGTIQTAVAGAGIDPLQIKPSLPPPDDFAAFWLDQKQKLSRVPINPRLTEVKSPQPDVDCYDLQADCIGAPVSGYFARPKGAKPGSLPIMLTVQGAGVRSSNLPGAAGWAKEGFLAMDINAHGIPNGKPDKFYDDLSNGSLKEYRTAGRESRETVYFLGMFLRIVRALDFLTSRPEWDQRTVVVHGGSQGGAQSIVAAGLDPRVTFFAAGVPAMCDHTGGVVDRISGWPKFVPVGPDGKPDPKVLEVARYYDAMNFASRAICPGIMTVGFIDTTCPPTSVYAAYNALKGRKEIFNDPPSTHMQSPQSLAAMRKAISAHVAKMKAAATK